MYISSVKCKGSFVEFKNRIIRCEYICWENFFTAKLDFLPLGGEGEVGVKRLQEFAPRSGQIHVLLIAENTAKIYSVKVKLKGGFFRFLLFMYIIQHCFICRDSRFHRVVE
jgi:hypothetical protein